MQTAPIPDDDVARLDALHSSGLLDTPPEERFDRITRLARKLFGADIALVSLVDADRQWFKSCQGLSATETGRDISFCGHAILGSEIFHIPDATLDPRFADNPLVVGPPHIRFYAGAPLSTAEGFRIGTLCIIDPRPRELSEDDRAALRDLALLVEDEIKLGQRQRQQRALLALTQITSLPASEPRELLRAALGLGCEHLRLPVGIVSCVHDEGARLQVEVQVAPSGLVEDGLHFAPAPGQCAVTPGSGDAGEVVHSWQATGEENGCYPGLGLRAYIGLPLRFEGSVCGRLDFGARETRPEGPFSREDIKFVRLLGAWVSTRMRHWALDKSLQQHQRLNDAITRAQARFIREVDYRSAFDELLEEVLALTDSRYGFIGEVLASPSGAPYLKTHAVTDIAWDDDSHAFYAAHASKGLEFRNLDSLFGAALRTGEVVIANDPAHDARRGGLPDGHPALHAFLGIPIHYNGEVLAMIGVANRPGGYDGKLVDFLQPLVATIAQLMEAVRNQRRQRESERRLADVIEATNIGTWEWNLQSGAFVFNERWAQIVGYRPDELQPAGIDTWFALIHPEDLDDASRLLHRHLEGEIDHYDMQCRLHHKDGRWVWVHERGRVISWTDDGKPLLMSGSHADITVHKESEAALRDQAEHTQAILGNMVDGIVTIDEKGLIASVNGAAERIFGHPAHEMVGRNVSLLMPSPHREAHDGYLDEYHRTGVGRVIGAGREVEALRRDGTVFPAELSVSEITRGGRPMYVGIVRDITERKRIERMKTELISTVSHELRTPLTSISGALGLIAGGMLGEMPAPVRQMIDIAHKNSQRLTYLIDDFLDMEKLVAGKMQFDLQRHRLIALVEQAIDTNHAYGAARRVGIARVGEMPDVEVTVDAQRFMQVMSNLISNAVKYSPDGGTVEVAAAPCETGVRITVTDHGPGIPPAFFGRIFQKFAQADSSDTRQKGGTGLGLAITKELVERMGGRIGFDSVEGEGARFHVELPLADAPPSSHAARTRILVVDESPDVTAELVAVLDRAGYAVDTAGSAEAALSLLSRTRYAAITLDLTLPDMSGLEFVHRLRRDPQTADVPLIVVSARIEAGRLAISSDFPRVDWLAKPIDEARLLAAIEGRGGTQRLARQRMLHVEDDADLQQVVRAMVGERLAVVPASTLAQARDRLARERFDVVLLDIGLPDGTGWDLLPELREGQPQARVVILSGTDTSGQDARRVEAVLRKSRLSPEQLLEAIGARINDSLSEGAEA